MEAQKVMTGDAYSEGNGSALHSAQHSAAGSGVVERVEDVRAWPANQPPGQSDGSTESYDRRKGLANSGSARLLPTRGVKRSLGKRKVRSKQSSDCH
jgi:hypothetical protein